MPTILKNPRHLPPFLLPFHLLFLLHLVACSTPTGDEAATSPAAPPAGEHATQTASDDHHDHHGDDHDDDHDDHHDDDDVELSPEMQSWAEIRTARVEARIVAARMTTTGEVGFDQDRLAHVSPRLTGRVHRVHTRLGETVESGQILAEIDSIELGRAKAEYQTARAHHALARQNHARMKELFAEEITSEQTLLTVETALREAAVALEAAEEILRIYGLDGTTIEDLDGDSSSSLYALTAPFAATIIERHVTLGELVTPERNLFTLTDLGWVWIWIDVYQRDIGRVHLGDGARARVDAYPGETFAGTVSYVGAEIDPDTRTVRARLDVGNPGGKLRPGMFVEVELTDPHDTEGEISSVLRMAVPAEAVVRDGADEVVFVALGGPRFERRRIETGRRSDAWIEVLDGVEIGEEVVTEGTFFLKSELARGKLGGGHGH